MAEDNKANVTVEAEKQEQKPGPIEKLSSDGFDFLHPSSAVAAQPQIDPDEPPLVEWSAHEAEQRDKSSMWFVWLTVIGVVATAGCYLLTRDLVTTGAIGIVVAVVAAGAARPPQETHYKLFGEGVVIGERFYPIADYKSFSVIEEKWGVSIVFAPLKRFTLPLTLDCSPDNANEVATIVSELLPYEHRQIDAVERFAKRIRF